LRDGAWPAGGRAGFSRTGRALPLVLLCLGLPADAHGEATVPRSIAEAEGEFLLGARAEGEGAFPRALEHYRACLDGQAPLRLAHGARNRIRWIEERAEGNFLPLATLARVRRDSTVLSDPAALEKLATEVEAFPAGLVRSELRLRVAEARLKHDGSHAAALAGLRVIVGDASSGASDRMLAERDLVAALLAAGQLDEARAEVEAHPFDPKSTAEVERLVRRRWLVRVAGILGGLALVALVLMASPRLRRPPGGARLRAA
jgi:hypothetical protein